MAEAQPYYGQKYHGSEFLSAEQLMFHRSPYSTDWLFLYHNMDASLRRAFLPLPRSFSLANPPFLEVMKSKHGDILVLPESSTNDDSCWNAEKMVNQTESHRLFNNISLCSFSTILWGRYACKAKEAVVGNRVNLQPGEIHLQCTARNTDGVEQRMTVIIGAEILT